MLFKLILAFFVKTELGQEILVDLYKKYIFTTPRHYPSSYFRKDYTR